jgi:hypothetical protein
MFTQVIGVWKKFTQNSKFVYVNQQLDLFCQTVSPNSITFDFATAGQSSFTYSYMLMVVYLLLVLILVPVISPLINWGTDCRIYTMTFFGWFKGKLASNVSYNIKGSLWIRKKNRALFKSNTYTENSSNQDYVFGNWCKWFTMIWKRYVFQEI